MNEKSSERLSLAQSFFFVLVAIGGCRCAQVTAYDGPQTSVANANDTSTLDDQSSTDTATSLVERALTDGSGGGSYPRIVHLADDTLLATFTRVSGTTQALVVARSTDGGLTFKDVGTLDAGNHQLEGASVVEMPAQSGQTHPKLFAAYCNHDIDSSGNNTFFRISISQSADGGLTWAAVSQAATKSAPLGLWEPFLRLGTAGDLQLVYALENSATDQDLVRRTSSDNGVTWSSAVTVAGGNTTARIGVPGIATTMDANRAAQVLVYETNKDGNYVVASFISYDDGSSWSNRTVVYQAANGHNAGAPQIISFSDGSLATVFMTDEDASTVNWSQNSAVKVVFSAAPSNGIFQWSAPQSISPASSYWPGICLTGNDKAFAVYTRGGPLGRVVLPGSVPQ